MTDSPTPGTTGPPIRVTLPDGQTVTATLHGRRQEKDRTWWYTVSLGLWSKTELGGTYRAEPGPVVFDVDAKHCTPVDGQDYSAVPTERAWEPPRFAVERFPVTVEDGIRLVLHRAGCRVGGAQRLPVRTLQARTALDDGAELCPVCRPDTGLRA